MGIINFFNNFGSAAASAYAAKQYFNIFKELSGIINSLMPLFYLGFGLAFFNAFVRLRNPSAIGTSSNENHQSKIKANEVFANQLPLQQNEEIIDTWSSLAVTNKRLLIESRYGTNHSIETFNLRNLNFIKARFVHDPTYKHFSIIIAFLSGGILLAAVIGGNNISQYNPEPLAQIDPKFNSIDSIDPEISKMRQVLEAQQRAGFNFGECDRIKADVFAIFSTNKQKVDTCNYYRNHNDRIVIANQAAQTERKRIENLNIQINAKNQKMKSDIEKQEKANQVIKNILYLCSLLFAAIAVLFYISYKTSKSLLMHVRLNGTDIIKILQGKTVDLEKAFKFINVLDQVCEERDREQLDSTDKVHSIGNAA